MATFARATLGQTVRAGALLAVLAPSLAPAHAGSAQAATAQTATAQPVAPANATPKPRTSTVAQPAAAAAKAPQAGSPFLDLSPALLRTFGYYRPDCTGGGLPTVSVITPPLHGTVSFKSDVPFTVESTNNGKCIGTVQRGVSVIYTPTARATDALAVQVTYPDAHVEKIQFSIAPK